jgi:hypothetical protein
MGVLMGMGMVMVAGAIFVSSEVCHPNVQAIPSVQRAALVSPLKRFSRD